MTDIMICSLARNKMNMWVINLINMIVTHQFILLIHLLLLVHSLFYSFTLVNHNHLISSILWVNKTTITILDMVCYTGRKSKSFQHTYLILYLFCYGTIAKQKHSETCVEFSH